MQNAEERGTRQEDPKQALLPEPVSPSAFRICPSREPEVGAADSRGMHSERRPQSQWFRQFRQLFQLRQLRQFRQS